MHDKGRHKEKEKEKRKGKKKRRIKEQEENWEENWAGMIDGQRHESKAPTGVQARRHNNPHPRGS